MDKSERNSPVDSLLTGSAISSTVQEEQTHQSKARNETRFRKGIDNRQSSNSIIVSPIYTLYRLYSIFLVVLRELRRVSPFRRRGETTLPLVHQVRRCSSEFRRSQLRDSRPGDPIRHAGIRNSAEGRVPVAKAGESVYVHQHQRGHLPSAGARATGLSGGRLLF